MGRAMFGGCWAFIFVAAAYDSYFAWHYRDVFAAWEQNPLACWAFAQFGLLAILAFKFLGLSLAAVLACRCRGRHRPLEYPLTLVIACAYGLLVAHYAASAHDPHSEQAAAYTALQLASGRR
jgi:hypothetical protein